MESTPFDRRLFLKAAAAQAAVSGIAEGVLAQQPPPEYRGPNLVIVRFGGGVRRLETTDPQHTYAPWFRHELCKLGTLYTDMRLSELARVDGKAAEVVTSHGQGMLNILTGRYDLYKDFEERFLSERYESRVPTLFEYLRKAYNVPDDRALLVNGEDRTQVEFYSFSNHHLFGVSYRCSVLSLFRFKCHLLRRQIASGRFTGKDLEEKRRQLGEKEALDYRNTEGGAGQGQNIEAFWEKWREHYGETGLVNPRGDALLTELAVRALHRLKPRLMMVNYQDPDYVHWGNIHHYTRGISVIDQGLRTLFDVCQSLEAYRDNTLFVVVPDCGRDNNKLVAVPCQHHFNSRSAREIFALLVGPGIRKGVVVDRPVDQIAVAPTVGKMMGLKTEFAEGDVLEDALA